MSKHYLKPRWPAPPQVHAYTTLRTLGNLATHVNDEPERVQRNRDSLYKELNINPTWLEQVHGIDCVDLSHPQGATPQADAAYTGKTQQVCAVLTADCLPLLLCDPQGQEVAAIHAGWRGLLGGVIESTLEQFKSPAHELLVWLGPAIGPQAFEVGEEVYVAFTDKNSQNSLSFTKVKDRWHADIYQLARTVLQQFGITQIFGGDYCTVNDEDHFFSYRREGAAAGRMASLIWIDH